MFLDKPTAPRGPLKADEVRADHVKLSWKRPEDTGGQELQGYVIEKMDVDTGRWVPAGEVGPNENAFTVDGLTPKKKYKFRVKAKNKDGESPPLVTMEEIEAKNPYGDYPLVMFLLIFHFLVKLHFLNIGNSSFHVGYL